MMDKKFFNFASRCLVLALVLSPLLITGAPALAALPSGSIAVLTRASSDWFEARHAEQHAASVASILTRELIAKGYRVVDPNTLANIRRNKAAALALQGNVDAIMNLGRQYGFSTMITAQLQAGEPRRNQFNLYTGTASVAIMVMSSGGQMIYADTVSGKQVGYTPDEAAQKSIEAAAILAVENMIR